MFFDFNYTSLQQTLLTVFVFVLTIALLLYVIYFFLTKISFRKSKLPREINLRLTFLWSLFGCLILFNVYLFIVLYKIGIDAFRWESPAFYSGIIAPLFIYAGLLTYFFVKRQALRKIVNKNPNQ